MASFVFEAKRVAHYLALTLTLTFFFFVSPCIDYERTNERGSRHGETNKHTHLSKFQNFKVVALCLVFFLFFSFFCRPFWNQKSRPIFIFSNLSLLLSLSISFSSFQTSKYNSLYFLAFFFLNILFISHQISNVFLH